MSSKSLKLDIGCTQEETETTIKELHKNNASYFLQSGIPTPERLVEAISFNVPLETKSPNVQIEVDFTPNFYVDWFNRRCVGIIVKCPDDSNISPYFGKDTPFIESVVVGVSTDVFSAIDDSAIDFALLTAINKLRKAGLWGEAADSKDELVSLNTTVKSNLIVSSQCAIGLLGHITHDSVHALYLRVAHDDFKPAQTIKERSLIVGKESFLYKVAAEVFYDLGIDASKTKTYNIGYWKTNNVSYNDGEYVAYIGCCFSRAPALPFCLLDDSTGMVTFLKAKNGFDKKTILGSAKYQESKLRQFCSDASGVNTYLFPMFMKPSIEKSPDPTLAGLKRENAANCIIHMDMRKNVAVPMLDNMSEFWISEARTLTVEGADNLQEIIFKPRRIVFCNPSSSDTRIQPDDVIMLATLIHSSKISIELDDSQKFNFFLKRLRLNGYNNVTTSYEAVSDAYVFNVDHLMNPKKK